MRRATWRIGDRVGPYLLEEEIGMGGMGQVFRASREGVPEPVALKVIRAELCEDATHIRRFMREARILASITHPHIVDVVDVGEFDGRPYLAMRLLPGRPLDAVLREHGPLSLGAVLRLVANVAEALDLLHARGLYHRDIKASNIMLDTGSAILMDFGLAKSSEHSVLTQKGRLLGTLDYLAPELIEGAQASAASDIYALGCVTFEALTGDPPFTGGMFEIGIAHLEREPPDVCAKRPDAPPGIGVAVRQALAKQTAQRPSTATDFARMLEGAAA